MKPVFTQELSVGKCLTDGFATMVPEMPGAINVSSFCNVATNVAR